MLEHILLFVRLPGSRSLVRLQDFNASALSSDDTEPHHISVFMAFPLNAAMMDEDDPINSSSGTHAIRLPPATASALTSELHVYNLTHKKWTLNAHIAVADSVNIPFVLDVAQRLQLPDHQSLSAWPVGDGILIGVVKYKAKHSVLVATATGGITLLALTGAEKCVECLRRALKSILRKTVARDVPGYHAEVSCRFETDQQQHMNISLFNGVTISSIGNNSSQRVLLGDELIASCSADDAAERERPRRGRPSLPVTIDKAAAADGTTPTLKLKSTLNVNTTVTGLPYQEALTAHMEANLQDKVAAPAELLEFMQGGKACCISEVVLAICSKIEGGPIDSRVLTEAVKRLHSVSGGADSETTADATQNTFEAAMIQAAAMQQDLSFTLVNNEVVSYDSSRHHETNGLTVGVDLLSQLIFATIDSDISQDNAAPLPISGLIDYLINFASVEVDLGAHKQVFVELSLENASVDLGPNTCFTSTPTGKLAAAAASSDVGRIWVKITAGVNFFNPAPFSMYLQVDSLRGISEVRQLLNECAIAIMEHAALGGDTAHGTILLDSLRADRCEKAISLPGGSALLFTVVARALTIGIASAIVTETYGQKTRRLNSAHLSAFDDLSMPSQIPKLVYSLQASRPLAFMLVLKRFIGSHLPKCTVQQFVSIGAQFDVSTTAGELMWCSLSQQAAPSSSDTSTTDIRKITKSNCDIYPVCGMPSSASPFTLRVNNPIGLAGIVRCREQCYSVPLRSSEATLTVKDSYKLYKVFHEPKVVKGGAQQYDLQAATEAAIAWDKTLVFALESLRKRPTFRVEIAYRHDTFLDNLFGPPEKVEIAIETMCEMVGDVLLQVKSRLRLQPIEPVLTYMSLLGFSKSHVVRASVRALQLLPKIDSTAKTNPENELETTILLRLLKEEVAAISAFLSGSQRHGRKQYLGGSIASKVGRFVGMMGTFPQTLVRVLDAYDPSGRCRLSALNQQVSTFFLPDPPPPTMRRIPETQLLTLKEHLNETVKTRRALWKELVLFKCRCPGCPSDPFGNWHSLQDHFEKNPTHKDSNAGLNYQLTDDERDSFIRSLSLGLEAYPELKSAFDTAVFDGQPTLIVGPAGTGKTTLNNKIIRALTVLFGTVGSPILVTALQGVAAVRYENGRTTHSALGVHVNIDDMSEDEAVAKLVTHINSNPPLKRRLLEVRVVIRDEMFMSSAFLAHVICSALRIIRTEQTGDVQAGAWARSPLLNGGVQMIDSGDCLQLPAWATGSKRVTQFWESPSLDYYHIVLLTTIFRQQSGHFQNMLATLRLTGKINVAFYKEVAKREKWGSLVEDARGSADLHVRFSAMDVYKTLLDAAAKNKAELDNYCKESGKLKVTLTAMDARKAGSSAPQPSSDDQYDIKQLPREINIAVGVPVMALANQTERGFQNGTIGVVTNIIYGCVQETGFKRDITEVHITVPARTKGGPPTLAKIVPILCYASEGTGKIFQFPLTLAFALNGQKLQSAEMPLIHVHVGDMTGVGLLYVCLSRTLSGPSCLFSFDELERLMQRVSKDEKKLTLVDAKAVEWLSSISTNGDRNRRLAQIRQQQAPPPPAAPQRRFFSFSDQLHTGEYDGNERCKKKDGKRGGAAAAAVVESRRKLAENTGLSLSFHSSPMEEY